MAWPQRATNTQIVIFFIIVLVFGFSWNNHDFHEHTKCRMSKQREMIRINLCLFYFVVVVVVAVGIVQRAIGAKNVECTVAVGICHMLTVQCMRTAHYMYNVHSRGYSIRESALFIHTKFLLEKMLCGSPFTHNIKNAFMAVSYPWKMLPERQWHRCWH